MAVAPETPRPEVTPRELISFRADPKRADHYAPPGVISTRFIIEPPPFELPVQEWEIFSRRKLAAEHADDEGAIGSF